MKPLSRSVIVVAPLVLLAAACGSARMVRRDAQGGRIHVAGGFMERATDARFLMREHCRGPYAVRPEVDSAEPTGGWLEAPARGQTDFDFVCVQRSAGTEIAQLSGSRAR